MSIILLGTTPTFGTIRSVLMMKYILNNVFKFSDLEVTKDVFIIFH